MTTEQYKVRTHIAPGRTQVFTLTLTEACPARVDAVQLLRKSRCAMHPIAQLPSAVNSMNEAEVQIYLDAHPVPQQWKFISIDESNNVSDAELHLLGLFPELEILQIMSNKVSDGGMQHIARLENLETLTVYSDHITDACLSHLGNLQKLQVLDMQRSPRITRGNFDALIRMLPKLKTSYPPLACI